MATQPSKDQVAAELNRLKQQGATEDQISVYIAKSGYKDDDFTVSLKGVIQTWAQADEETAPNRRIAGRDFKTFTPEEARKSDEYYRNLAASSSDTDKPPTGGNTSTTVTTIRQSTGGGVTTTYDLPPQDTPQSLVYKQEAKNAFELQGAYQLNPDSAFGKRALERRLANGTITQAQYDEIISSTPEQRIAKVQQYSQEYNAARDKEIAAQIIPPPQVVVTPEPASSEVRVDNQRTNAQSQAVSPSTDPQAERDEDNSARSVAEDNRRLPGLESPQNVDGDEFGNLDQAIADRAGTGLEEPPVLNDEETDNYLNSFQNTEPGIPEPPFPDEPRSGAEGGGDELGGAGVDGGVNTGQAETQQVQITAARDSNKGPTRFPEAFDWRVRIHLAPGANYLYKDPVDPGILEPLLSTGGVLFPYTPSIQLSYNANYESTDVAHSNYKIYNYKNSSVESISITGDFTAQDTYEASYVLAVIHFFRSVTKMFYGKDRNPVNGTPPPIVYLTGHGTYQFNYHPMVITNFTYSLPNDVDYINAGPGVGGTTGLSYYKPAAAPEQQNILTRINRLFSSRLQPGGVAPPPKFTQLNQGQNVENTRIPTKIQIQLSALPIVTRNAISNNFSLQQYARGELLRGNTRRTKGGGIW